MKATSKYIMESSFKNIIYLYKYNGEISEKGF